MSKEYALFSVSLRRMGVEVQRVWRRSQQNYHESWKFKIISCPHFFSTSSSKIFYQGWLGAKLADLKFYFLFSFFYPIFSSRLVNEQGDGYMTGRMWEEKGGVPIIHKLDNWPVINQGQCFSFASLRGSTEKNRGKSWHLKAWEP